MEYEPGILKKIMVTYTTFDLSEFNIGSQNFAFKHFIGYATNFFIQDKNNFHCDLIFFYTFCSVKICNLLTVHSILYQTPLTVFICRVHAVSDLQVMLSESIYDFDLSNVVLPLMVFVSYNNLIQSLHVYVFFNMICSNCEKKNRHL